MKTSAQNSFKAFSAGLALSCLVLAHRANGTVIYWDPNGTTSIGGNAIWDTTTSQWSASSTQVASGSLIPWNAADAAGFCAGPTSGTSQGTFTITVNTAITCAGIFNGNLSPGPCNLTISGSGSLNLASGTDAFSNGGTGPPTGNTTITIPITGTVNGVLNSQGSGQLFLHGANTYIGGTLLGGSGIVGFNNSKSFGVGPITLENGATS